MNHHPVLDPLAMAGVVCPPLWRLAALAGEGWMATLHGLAAWPWAVWALPLPPLWLGAPASGAGILLCLPLPWHLRLLGAPLLAALLVWRPPAPPLGEFSLLAADIGQGNAVLVRTAHHALLYDTGPRYSLESDAGQRVLVPMLDAQQVRLDRIVLSHRDADHVGGAAAVRAAQPQAEVLSTLEHGHPLLDQASALRCSAGQHWEWDGVRFEVLHPAPEMYAQLPAPKPNALSCVLRVQSAGGLQPRSALLMGDLESPGEAQLLARAASAGRSLAADFLLVPHHGSKTSSSTAFLEAVHPRTVLVQAGYRNRYGHPAAPVVQRYQDLAGSYPPDAPLQWVDSPHCGAFLWKSWEPADGICARLAQQRYWHHVAP
jgi:competence protein ComEC